MNAQTSALLIVGGGALGVVVWVLATLGKALVTIAEALAAAVVVVVFLAIGLAIKVVFWAFRQTFIHWRTSLTLLALLAWWHWWGWASLASTAGVIAGVLTGWRLINLSSFDAWAGRYLRSWWLRWSVYAPKLPGWLHACGLAPDTAPIMVALTSRGRTFAHRRRPARAQLPRVLGVRSGASWDEVRARLLPGQKPEDVDEAARALGADLAPDTTTTLPLATLHYLATSGQITDEVIV